MAVGVGVGEAAREEVGVGVGVGTRPPWREGGSAVSWSVRPLPVTRVEDKHICMQYYLESS